MMDIAWFNDEQKVMIIKKHFFDIMNTKLHINNEKFKQAFKSIYFYV